MHYFDFLKFNFDLISFYHLSSEIKTNISESIVIDDDEEEDDGEAVIWTDTSFNQARF